MLTPEFFSMISAIVLSIAGIVITIICAYIPRVRKEKLHIAWKEMRDIYIDLEKFIKLEDYLEKASGISKQKARSMVNISNRCQPKKISERIKELDAKIN